MYLNSKTRVLFVNTLAYKSMIGLTKSLENVLELGPTVALLFTCYFDSIMLNIKERAES